MEGGGRVETFIIDTFTRVDNNGVEHAVDQEDQIGGGGTYAILGARMWLTPSCLGMIVDYTPDTLPDQMRGQLEHFGTDMWCFRIRDDGEPTCRAVNRYTENLRVFEYLSPPRYISPSDILVTPWCDPLPAAIHVISELRFLDNHFGEIRELQRKWEGWAPKIVWEPLPYDCVPARLEGVKRIAAQVDILTPNHTEALALFSMPSPENSSRLRSAIEDVCHRLAEWHPRQGVIIRAGALGSCYLSTAHDVEPTQSEVEWVPAYWSSEDPQAVEKVVDPTGAGNAFCGALAASLALNLSLYEAVLRATVSASYMIEQHGLPTLERRAGGDAWNGESPEERMEKLRRRVVNS